MVYSWTATSWVRSEMHSEADTSPVGTAEFFEVAEETLHRHGRYVAPFPGIHGWYWLNETDRPVTVTLHAAGFFSTSTEFLEGVAPIVREITETPDSTAFRPLFLGRQQTAQSQPAQRLKLVQSESSETRSDAGSPP